MKRLLLSVAILLTAVSTAAFAETIDGQVTGIDLIRKSIYIIPQDMPGHEEKFVWDDTLPGKEYLEAAAIGDEIVLNVDRSADGRVVGVSSSFHRTPDPATEKWEYSVTHPEAVPTDSPYAPAPKASPKPKPISAPDFMPIMPAEAAEPDQLIQKPVPAQPKPAAVTVIAEPPAPASDPAPAPVSSPAPVQEEIAPGAPHEEITTPDVTASERPRRPFGFIFNSVGGAVRSVGGAASHLNPWHHHDDSLSQ